MLLETIFFDIVIVVEDGQKPSFDFGELGFDCIKDDFWKVIFVGDLKLDGEFDEFHIISIS
jgi:hypothetical protein